MSDPKLVILGDSKAAQNEILALQKQLDKLDARLRGQSKTAQKGVAGIAGGFAVTAKKATDFMLAAAGMAGPIMAAYTATRLLNNEWERFQSRTKTLATLGTDLARLEQNAIFNLGPQADVSAAAMIERFKDISAFRGIDRKLVTAAGMEMLGARSDIKASRVIGRQRGEGMLGPILEKFRHDPAAAKLMGTAVLALEKSFPGIDPEAALGFISQVQTAGRVTDPSQLAEHIIPAITGAAAFGGRLDELGALTAVFGHGTEGRTGQATRTQILQFVRSLQERMNPLTGFAGLTSTDLRLKYLQENPEAALAFFHGGKWRGQDFGKGEVFRMKSKFGKAALGKGQIVPTAMALAGHPGVDPAMQSVVQKRYETFKDRLHDPVLEAELAAQIHRDELKDLATASEASQQAELKQRLRAATESMVRGRSKAVESAIIREEFDYLMDQLPVSALSDTIQTAGREILTDFGRSGSTRETTAAAIRDLKPTPGRWGTQDQLLGGWLSLIMGPGALLPLAWKNRPRKQTADEAAISTGLESFAQVLEGQGNAPAEGAWEWMRFMIGFEERRDKREKAAVNRNMHR